MKLTSPIIGFVFCFIIVIIIFKQISEKWFNDTAINIRNDLDDKFGTPSIESNRGAMWLNRRKGHKFILFDEEDKPLTLYMKINNPRYINKLNDKNIQYDVLGLSNAISYDRMKKTIQICCNGYDDGLIILILIFKIIDGRMTLQEVKDKKMYRTMMNYNSEKLERELNKFNF